MNKEFKRFLDQMQKQNDERQKRLMQQMQKQNDERQKRLMQQMQKQSEQYFRKFTAESSKKRQEDFRRFQRSVDRMSRWPAIRPSSRSTIPRTLHRRRFIAAGEYRGIDGVGG